MDSQKQIRWGLLLSYVWQGVSVLSGLLYTPVMLRLLGQNEYGLYQLSNSMISYLGLLNFGFSSGYLRLYFRYKAKDDEAGIELLNGMFIKLFICLSLICFVTGLGIIQQAELIFDDGLSKHEMVKIKILMFIMIISMIITFISSVFDCYISAYERFVFQRGIQVLKAIFNPFFTLPLLLMGYGSIAVTIVTAVVNFSGLVLSVVYCMKRLGMKFDFKRFDFKLLKELSVFTFYIFLGTVSDKINGSTDSVLLGRYLGTASVAVYGVGSQINGLYSMLSCTVATIYSPVINKIVAEDDDNEKLTEIFIQFGRMQFMILPLVFIGFIVFGKTFIKIWAGNEYGDTYYVTILLMSSSLIPLLQNCGIEIQKAKNKHKIRSLIYLLSALVNVIISIPLIRVYGEIGAAAGTLITMFIGSGLIMNYYNHYHIGIDIFKFWRNMLQLLPVYILSGICGCVYCCLNIESLKLTCLFGIIFIFLYIISVVMFGWDKIKNVI